MSKWLATICIFFMYFDVLQAQTYYDPIVQDTVHTIADQMPIPEGGYAKFYKYLQENLYYTQEALERKIEGHVFVSFVVDRQGLLHNIRIIKGLGYGLDEEVIRVFSESPPWTAGKNQQKNVCVKVTFQVVFKLPR